MNRYAILAPDNVTVENVVLMVANAVHVVYPSQYILLDPSQICGPGWIYDPQTKSFSAPAQ